MNAPGNEALSPLPQTNQRPCVYGSQEYPPPAQGLPLAGSLAPSWSLLQLKWVTRHSVSTPAPGSFLHKGPGALPSLDRQSWLSQVGTRSGHFKEGRPVGGLSRTVRVGGSLHRKTDTALPCVTGEHPQACLKRQVGRGRAAMEWGAVDLTWRPCRALPRCPGPAEWASVGLDANQYHSVPQACSGPWPSSPVYILVMVRGHAILHLGFLSLHPGPRVAFEDGAGRAELQPFPEAGRQFLSSARERLVPNQRGVQKGNGKVREKGCVGFDRREDRSLSFGKPEAA